MTMPYCKTGCSRQLRGIGETFLALMTKIFANQFVKKIKTPPAFKLWQLSSFVG